MSYSPKALQEKVRQERLADEMLRKVEAARLREQEAAEEALIKEEQSKKRKHLAERRKATSLFYDVGRELLEAAIAGEMYKNYTESINAECLELLDAGSFNIVDMGKFSPSKLVEDFPEFNDAFGDMVDDEIDIQDEMRTAFQNIYDDYSACWADDWNTTTDEERTLYELVTIIGSTNDQLDFDDIVGRLEKLWNYFKGRPKPRSNDSDAYIAISSIREELAKLDGLLSRYKQQQGRNIFLVQIRWDDYADRENRKFPFFTNTFFRWVASGDGKVFTNAIFSSVKQSIASGISECLIDFEFTRPFLLNQSGFANGANDARVPVFQKKYGEPCLYFNGSELPCSIEQIEGMLDCLGYRVKTIKNKDPDKLQLKISWKSVN